MKPNELTLKLLGEVVDALCQRFPDKGEDDRILTDIHATANAETGQLVLCDDDDVELFATIIDEWADYNGEDFNAVVTETMSRVFADNRARLEALGLVQPFTIELIGEDREHVADLFNADQDNFLLDNTELLKGLDDELDDFLNKLLGE